MTVRDWGNRQAIDALALTGLKNGPMGRREVLSRVADSDRLEGERTIFAPSVNTAGAQLVHKWCTRGCRTSE